MSTNSLARRWQITSDNSNHTIGKTSVKNDAITNVIAFCTEVYPEFLIAKIESHELGTRVLPYLPESGIRRGTTVLVQIASGVPRITSKLYFGFKPESIAIMDLDFSNSDLKKAIYRNSSIPVWSDKEGEKYGYQPVIIKHKPGEKVYHVDFQGLKIGFKKVVLFYHPSARIEVFKII